MSGPLSLYKRPHLLAELTLGERQAFKLRSALKGLIPWGVFMGVLLVPWGIAAALVSNKDHLSFIFMGWTILGVPIGVYSALHVFRGIKAGVDRDLDRALERSEAKRAAAALEAEARARLVGGATEGTPVAVPSGARRDDDAAT